MKFAISLLLAMSATAFCSTVAPTQKGILSHNAAPAKLDWNQVQEYILDHAVRVDALTMQLLKYEVDSGVQTWTLTDRQESDMTFRLDGPGLGWPAAKLTIEFASTEEAEEAAILILEATAGGSR